MSEAVLLLHGSYVDDFLVAAVVIYLVIMVGLAQRKRYRLKQEKLRRQTARRARQQAPQAAPHPENFTAPGDNTSPTEIDAANQS